MQRVQLPTTSMCCCSSEVTSRVGAAMHHPHAPPACTARVQQSDGPRRYMEKLAVGPRVNPHMVSLLYPIERNLRAVAGALEKPLG